jgi:hypothetical protein
VSRNCDSSGRDHDLFELQALAEHGGGTSALVPGLPDGDHPVGLFLGEQLVAGEVAGGGAAVGEVACVVLLRGEAEPDALGGVANRRQAEQRAGCRVGAEVPQIVAVNLAAVSR